MIIITEGDTVSSDSLRASGAKMEVNPGVLPGKPFPP